jgi:hypothetical protein
MKSVPLVAPLFLTASLAAAQDAGAGGRQAPGEMGFFRPTEIQWKEGPASLRKGAKMAVLEGDPTREGAFTMRLRLPDGFEVAPHWHTQVEHVTVISGLIQFGFGERFDRTATRAMPAGSLGYWPIGMRTLRLGGGGDRAPITRPGTMDDHLREPGGRPSKHSRPSLGQLESQGAEPGFSARYAHRDRRLSTDSVCTHRRKRCRPSKFAGPLSGHQRLPLSLARIMPAAGHLDRPRRGSRSQRTHRRIG